MNNLLTPYIIACEIAMVMNQQRPGAVKQLDKDVKVQIVPDIDGGLYIHATARGIRIEQGPMKTAELAMDLDPFSERYVQPVVAAFLDEFDRSDLASFDQARAAKH
nr:hypothetical protein HUO10_003313 [Paraburkholderia busanensis]